MIQRFCFAKLLDDEVATRTELAQLLRARFETGGAAVVVGLPADDSAVRWDLSIVITAATLADWHALAARPAIVGAFEELAARAAVIKAWTFEAA